MSNAAEWDAVYGQRDLVWSATPNRWVQEATAHLPPGRALDLGAGEGRNSLWLAERGWQVTAVDFSRVGLDRANQLAQQRLGSAGDRLRTVCADLLEYEPTPHGYDLVLVVYLQFTAGPRRQLMRMAASAVAPGGLLLVTAHDTDNLTRGYGGPSDPAVLYRAEDVTADLDGTGLRVDRAAQVVREVDVEGRTERALDVLVLASRPARP